MNDITIDDPNRNDALGACIDAMDGGQEAMARKLMDECPGLAIELAFYFRDLAQIGPGPATVSMPHVGGERVGDFQLLHSIGDGGQGLVYKAIQLPFNRTVAVKLMRTRHAGDSDDVKRFRRDSALLADLDHPNIVKVFHAGDSEQGPYYAMEFLSGTSLKKKVEDKLLPTPRRAAELIRDLALGMQHVHDRGIVHRDLKPGNVMIEDDGTPKIVDFGLGKKLDSSESLTKGPVGTASYMSPEAAAGALTDHRSDIYGLGAILYELLTGQPPFAAATFHETLREVLEKDPRLIRLLNPNVPTELEIICLRCLEKDPARRFSSARELAAELQRYLDGEPILTSAPGITDRIFRTLLRQRFSNVRAWGWILLWYGVSSALFNGIHWWAILTDQSPFIATGIILAHIVCIAGITWLGLWRQKLRVGDWQSVSFVAANIVPLAFLALVFRRPEGMDTITYRCSMYPITALFQAAIIFPQGKIFWGGFHVLGMAWILVGVIMSFAPEWAAGTYALFNLVTLTPLGAYMVKMVPEFQDDPVA